MFGRKISLNKIGKKGGHVLISMKATKTPHLKEIKQVLPSAYNKSPLEK